MLLSATVTVVDGDNDTATGTVSADLGGNIRFEDDVPSVTINAVADGGITLTTQDAQTIDAASDTATGSFAAAFLRRRYELWRGRSGHHHGERLQPERDRQQQRADQQRAGHHPDQGGQRHRWLDHGWEVFRISVASNGTVTLTQSAELDHLPETWTTATTTTHQPGQWQGAAECDCDGGGWRQRHRDRDGECGPWRNIRFEDDVPSVTINAVGRWHHPDYPGCTNH